MKQNPSDSSNTTSTNVSAAKQPGLRRQLDWVTTLVPFGCILLLCLLFIAAPEASGNVLASIRFFLGDELGSYYLII